MQISLPIVAAAAAFLAVASAHGHKNTHKSTEATEPLSSDATSEAKDTKPFDFNTFLPGQSSNNAGDLEDPLRASYIPVPGKSDMASELINPGKMVKKIAPKHKISE